MIDIIHRGKEDSIIAFVSLYNSMSFCEFSRAPPPPAALCRTLPGEGIKMGSAVGGRRSAVGGRRSAVGGRRSAVGGRRSAVGGPVSFPKCPVSFSKLFFSRFSRKKWAKQNKIFFPLLLAATNRYNTSPGQQTGHTGNVW